MKYLILWFHHFGPWQIHSEHKKRGDAVTELDALIAKNLTLPPSEWITFKIEENVEDSDEIEIQ